MTGALLALALAVEPPNVVIVSNHADARLVPVLVGELLALGVTVQRVDRGPNEVTPEDLREAARRAGAAAAFRLMTKEGRLEIWLADRVTGKFVLRDVLDDGRGARVREADIALRAVELLRASLLEVESALPPRGELRAPPELAAVTPQPPSSRCGLWIGASMSAYPGGPPPTPGFDVGAACALAGPWGLGLAATLPLATTVISAAEGTAVFTPRQFSLQARLAPSRPDARWHPVVGIGPGLLWVSSVGLAEPPLESRRIEVVLPALAAQVSVGVPLHRSLRVVLLGAALVTPGRASVRFAGRDVSQFGPVVLTAALSLEVRLP